MNPLEVLAYIKEILRQKLIQLVARVEILFRRSILLAKDPVLLWDFSRTLTLAIPSRLFLLPFAIAWNKDGLCLLTLRKNRLLKGISYTFNAVIAARLALFASICLNSNFEWNVDGKFTADAVTFCIILLTALMALSSNLTLLYSAQDFTFLHNSVRKLNKVFSGTFLPIQNSQVWPCRTADCRFIH